MSFALFSQEERGVIRPLCRKAVVASRPDKHQDSPESTKRTAFLDRMTRELIDVDYVSAATLREIVGSAPLGKIPFVVNNDNGVEVNLDRGCDPFDLASLRQAIIDISKEVARVLGNDTTPLEKMEGEKIEHEKAYYAQAVDYRYALNWLHELEDKENYLPTDLLHYTDKRFSGNVLLKDILKIVFGLEPWQITHAKHALKGLRSIIQKDLLEKNPYSSKGNFNFPYKEPKEALVELGYSEEVIQDLVTQNTMFRLWDKELTNEDIIWIILTFSEGEWGKASNNLLIAKRKKEEYQLPDGLFDYAISNEVDPYFYEKAIQLMYETYQDVKQEQLPPTGKSAGMTVVLNIGEKVIEKFQKKKIIRSEIDPEKFAKYRKPFLNYTRQYMALKDLEMKRTAGETTFRDDGIPLFAANRGGALIAAETSVERQIIEGVLQKIEACEKTKPGFLTDKFIPPIAEISKLVRKNAKGMDVFVRLNEILEAFTNLSELLQNVDIDQDANENVERSIRIILMTLYPEKKLVLGWDLLDVEDNLVEALNRMATSSPNFLQTIGIPLTSREIKQKLKAKFGVDYGEKLELFVGKTHYMAGNFQNAQTGSGYGKSKAFAMDKEAYISQTKELFT